MNQKIIERSIKPVVHLQIKIIVLEVIEVVETLQEVVALHAVLFLDSQHFTIPAMVIIRLTSLSDADFCPSPNSYSKGFVSSGTTSA